MMLIYIILILLLFNNLVKIKIRQNGKKSLINKM